MHISTVTHQQSFQRVFQKLLYILMDYFWYTYILSEKPLKIPSIKLQKFSSIICQGFPRKLLYQFSVELLTILIFFCGGFCMVSFFSVSPGITLGFLPGFSFSSDTFSDSHKSCHGVSTRSSSRVCSRNSPEVSFIFFVFH